MPSAQISDPHADDAALAAIVRDVATACRARLARVAGTHGLLLDGTQFSVPAVDGLACWTTLRPGADRAGWRGSLTLDLSELPFADASFCAVLLRFITLPEDRDIAELVRVLAPHGTVLAVGFHPGSLWGHGDAPGRWERALRRAGLDVAPGVRCGAPWPRARGAEGLPHWLVRGLGGAWIVEARHSVLATLPLRRLAASRSALEQGGLVPGARRACA